MSDDSLHPRDHAEAVALFRAEVIGTLARRELSRGELAVAMRERIRALTPDLPDYVATTFLAARRETHQLPSFVENLKAILEPEVCESVLARFVKALSSALSSQPQLHLPLALRLSYPQ